MHGKHKSISKTPTYTEEEVAEMLKIEENLLMRRLEMLKKEQFALQESTNSKVLNETKKSEQNIDIWNKHFKIAKNLIKNLKAKHLIIK